MTRTRAKDIMSTELLTANNKMTVEETMKLLVNNRVTGLPVVDGKGKMVGVVSEYDLIEQLAQTKSREKEFKKKISFSKKVRAIKDSTPLDNIVELFVTSKFRRLPVVNTKGILVGIITRRDLMRLFYYRSKLG